MRMNLKSRLFAGLLPILVAGCSSTSINYTRANLEDAVPTRDMIGTEGVEHSIIACPFIVGEKRVQFVTNTSDNVLTVRISEPNNGGYAVIEDDKIDGVVDSVFIYDSNDSTGPRFSYNSRDPAHAPLIQTAQKRYGEYLDAHRNKVRETRKIYADMAAEELKTNSERL